MKKVIILCSAVAISLGMIGCEAKQESKMGKENTTKETILASNTDKETKVSKVDNENNIDKYKKLIGLSKEEIINIMGKEHQTIDEGGLEFLNSGIRVWFGEDGKTVNQIFMNSSDIDFNGARVNDKIEDFKNIFGKPVLEDTQSAYSNFNYEGLVLHVQYDSNSGKVIAVYLMDEWK